MYLADDVFRQKSGVGSRTRVSFYSAEGSLFGVPEYAQVLEGVAERRQIETKFRHNLVALDVWLWTAGAGRLSLSRKPIRARRG
jgi:sulfide:quinone oxidoreductase